MSGVIQRTQYRNVNTGTIRTGATGHGESVTDLEEYLQPLDSSRAASVVVQGVAQGFEVVATAGSAGVTVLPGVAIDRVGRTVALTVGGVAVVVPDLDPGQVADIATVAVAAEGVSLETAGIQGSFVVTVTWQEAQDADALVLLHAPWLRLVPEADFDEGADPIALAQVTLDATEVTTLEAGPRQRIALRAGRLELGAVDVAAVDDATVVGTTALATLSAGSAEGVVLDLVGGAAAPVRALRVDPATGEVQVPEGVLTSALRTASPGDVTHEVRSEDDGSWSLSDKGDVKRLKVDAKGNVGIGIGGAAPQRVLHVEGSEVHSGGGGGGFSFSDRASGTFVNSPGAGERWVWYGLGNAAHLWSGFDRISVSASGEGGGLDVARRMRVRQGGDGSAGIWLHQTAPDADRGFMGMSDDTHVGFYGAGFGWGFQMDTNTGELSFSQEFGRKWGPATLNLFGSVIRDVGGGTLSIRSGGAVVAFDGGDLVGIGVPAPQAWLDVDGRGGTAINARGHVVVNGDLRVQGRIFKGGGGFKIDHPLAPSEKFLSHSFVESPEMATLYAGTVTTDGEGRARVELPDYFEALNRDARVQLSTVDSFSAVTLDGPVASGAFTVRSADPGVTVDWLVTGVRQDVWAEANRIPVSEEKAPDERGRFLHPAEQFDHSTSSAKG